MKTYIELRNDLQRGGIKDVSERVMLTPWEVSKDCATTTGLVFAAGCAAAGAMACSFITPGIGCLPGYLAVAASGWVGGAAVCTLKNVGLQIAMDRLLDLIRSSGR